jgi:hypothetical protein
VPLVLRAPGKKEPVTAAHRRQGLLVHKRPHVIARGSRGLRAPLLRDSLECTNARQRPYAKVHRSELDDFHEGRVASRPPIPPPLSLDHGIRRNHVPPASRGSTHRRPAAEDLPVNGAVRTPVDAWMLGRAPLSGCRCSAEWDQDGSRQSQHRESFHDALPPCRALRGFSRLRLRPQAIQSALSASRASAESGRRRNARASRART